MNSPPDPAALERLRVELRALVGLMCWYAPSFQRDLRLGFGEAFDKSPPAASPLLVYLWEAHQFTKGPRLFIECPWRAEFEGRVVRCSANQEELSAPRRPEEHKIQGSVVTACELHEPVLDLEIVFDSGIKLHVACRDTALDGDGYSLLLPDQVLRVGPRGHVTFNRPEPPAPRGGPGGELVPFPSPRR